MSVAYYINQGKYSLKASVDVTTLSIASAVFNYIDPAGTESSFTAIVDSVNNQVYYNIETADITVVGTWQIWATFTDGSGNTVRGDTTDVRFLDDTE